MLARFRAGRQLMKTVAAFMVALACAMPALAQANKADIEKALIAQENKINEAVAKGDAAAFNAMIPAEAMATDPSGMMAAQDFSKEFKNVKITAWKISDSKVIWVDDKTAIHTYVWTGKGTMMGQRLPEKMYASTVYTDRGGKWVPIFHQETEAMKMPPPPPPKKK